MVLKGINLLYNITIIIKITVVKFAYRKYNGDIRQKNKFKVRDKVENSCK